LPANWQASRPVSDLVGYAVLALPACIITLVGARTRPVSKGTTMSEPQAPSRAQEVIGDFAPKLVSLTDDVLFGDVWKRPELAPRDRSLITVAALITGGNTEQLRAHLGIAKDNGLTETELKEAIIHLAFYAGWPKAMSAISVAKQVFNG
jgi:4-carboxymuconolactone decarboxylase